MKNKQEKKKRNAVGIILKIFLAPVLIVILTMVIYLVYMQINYHRIKDNTKLKVENNNDAVLKIGETYTAVTYNIGFGAYGPEYSFFMDTGEMDDGTPTQGEHGKALSKESVENHTEGAIRELEQMDADFLLLQEVDIDSDRSYHVDQAKEIKKAFSLYGNIFVNNFHSAYLFYPLSDPHGAVQSGLLNLSRYQISEAERRSYPVDDSFIKKFTDLDRCFAVMRLPIEGGHELVLINSHMSAYDKDGKIRARQLELLNSVMKEEYLAGNYVIVGGDFNHALGEEVAEGFPSRQKFPSWVSLLTQKDIADGITIQRAENELEVPTCRGADIAYTKGVNYTTVVDGFLVSDNVKATAENIDTDFAYSDHNPVKLTFELLGE